VEMTSSALHQHCSSVWTKLHWSSTQSCSFCLQGWMFMEENHRIQCICVSPFIRIWFAFIQYVWNRTGANMVFARNLYWC